jgi:UPF0176 protein
MNSVAITTFYRFLPLSPEGLPLHQQRMEQIAQSESLRGMVLLGCEGINATVSGSAAGLERFKSAVLEMLGVPHLPFKDSLGERHPFQIFRVKIKDEIVSLGKPGLVPQTPKNFHLSPQEWQAAMHEPGTVVIDTRNDYEVQIGKFKNAIDFNTQEFNQFPECIKDSSIAKDQKVLIYCTGGIRCEKAILEMHNQGFQKVFQLDGGILNYLKELPNQDYEGECFVFDYRVAVDQRLQPTRNYKLCPHCGQPAKQVIQCAQCGRKETICQRCESNGICSCSKNCAHHQAIGSGSSKSHLPELKKRQRLP